MAKIKGLLALSALITLSACASQAELNRAYSKGINDGRSMAGGQVAGYPVASAPGYPAPRPGVVQPQGAQPLVPMAAAGAARQQPTYVTSGSCSPPRMRFIPDLRGTPQEQQVLTSVHTFLCTPGNPSNGTITAAGVNGPQTVYSFAPAPK